MVANPDISLQVSAGTYEAFFFQNYAPFDKCIALYPHFATNTDIVFNLCIPGYFTVIANFNVVADFCMSKNVGAWTDINAAFHFGCVCYPAPA